MKKIVFVFCALVFVFASCSDGGQSTDINWLGYSDDDLRFEISYPETWDVQCGDIDFATVCKFDNIVLLYFSQATSYEDGLGGDLLSQRDTAEQFLNGFGAGAYIDQLTVDSAVDVSYSEIMDNGIYSMTDNSVGRLVLIERGDELGGGYFALIDDGNKHSDDGIFEHMVNDFAFFTENDWAMKKSGSENDGLDPLVLNLSGLSNENWNECDVEAAKIAIAESGIEDVHPEQITACYSLADVSFFFVSKPNSWTALPEVRSWESDGNKAWSGLLFKHVEGPVTVFLKIEQDDYNPVGLYLEDEALVLDTADDSGAGSGEGQLLRYVYPFAGVAEDLLYEWANERCTGYYNPDVYLTGQADCN